MDLLIAVCAGLIAGFAIGSTIAWIIQKKRLEEGFKKWAMVKTVNEYGKRIPAKVKIVTQFKGTNRFRITAEYQDPFTNAIYPLEKTFLITDTSPGFIRKLKLLESVSVLVFVDTTSRKYLSWMERPW